MPKQGGDSCAAATTRRLGPYRIVGELGHGGMGVVYLAERDDGQYRKQVAVKLLQRGLEPTTSVARFRDERQILAALEHPGIARLLDGGSTDDGLPYLVMEHVDGVPITAYASEHALSVARRGSSCSGRSARRCSTRTSGWSSTATSSRATSWSTPTARRSCSTSASRSCSTGRGGDRRGAARAPACALLTPEYASPEQVRGEPRHDGDRRLLARRGALRAARRGADRTASTATACSQMLRDDLRGRPAAAEHGRAAPSARPRARRRPRQHRPEGAAEGAGRGATLGRAARRGPRRHLDGLPVAARAATWSYRAGKFVRRRRGVVAAVTAVIATLAIATFVSLQQARRAQRRFADVRHLANSLLFEVDDRIQSLEGSTAARELIVSRALQYLDSLSREAGEDAALWHELATAYMKVGDIQGSSRAPSLGRPRDGIESYLRARQVLERLVASGQDDPATRWSLARALYRLGDLYRLDNQLGHARTSLLEAGRVVGQIPKTAGFDHRAVIDGHLALFGIEEQAGHPTAMAECAEKVLDVAREMAKTGDSAESRYWMGIAHEMAGFAHSRAADVDAALGDYGQARATFEALGTEYPENAAYRRELALTLSRLGGHHSGIGETSVWEPGWRNTPAAEEVLRESVRLRELQAERDPADQRTAVELANRIAHLAATLAVRSSQEAIGVFERAVHMHRRLPAAIRGSGYSRQMEWYTHCSRAEPLARIGRRGEARDAIAEGSLWWKRTSPTGASRDAWLSSRAATRWPERDACWGRRTSATSSRRGDGWLTAAHRRTAVQHRAVHRPRRDPGAPCRSAARRALRALRAGRRGMALLGGTGDLVHPPAPNRDHRGARGCTHR